MEKADIKGEKINKKRKFKMKDQIASFYLKDLLFCAFFPDTHSYYRFSQEKTKLDVCFSGKASQMIKIRFWFVFSISCYFFPLPKIRNHGTERNFVKKLYTDFLNCNNGMKKNEFVSVIKDSF
jgi:hypothetical protein